MCYYIYIFMQYSHLLTGSAQSVMNLNHLNSITHGYINEGLAPATRHTYSTGQQSFSTFCNASRSRVLPTTESALLLFISHLASKNISHTTIKVYLAAVHYMHVIAGKHNLFKGAIHSLASAGSQRHQENSDHCYPHLPITLQHHALGRMLLGLFRIPPCQRVHMQFPTTVPMIQEPTFH